MAQDGRGGAAQGGTHSRQWQAAPPLPLPAVAAAETVSGHRNLRARAPPLPRRTLAPSPVCTNSRLVLLESPPGLSAACGGGDGSARVGAGGRCRPVEAATAPCAPSRRRRRRQGTGLPHRAQGTGQGTGLPQAAERRERARPRLRAASSQPTCSSTAPCPSLKPWARSGRLEHVGRQGPLLPPSTCSHRQPLARTWAASGETASSASSSRGVQRAATRARERV